MPDVGADALQLLTVELPDILSIAGTAHAMAHRAIAVRLDRRADLDDRMAVGLALHRVAAVLEADDEQLLVSVGLTSLGDLLDRLDPDPYRRGDPGEGRNESTMRCRERKTIGSERIDTRREV